MIGVIFGGDSLEHEVSIASGKDILKEVPGRGFYLDKQGNWFVDGEKVQDILSVLKECDVVFPMIHGSPGEDGILQGFLEMHDIPYVGCDVVSSALCMDKDLTKRVLRTHNLPVVPFATYYSLEDALAAKISLPCVIKATSLGSSFGIHLVKDNPTKALEEAFTLGKKVLVEELVKGRELWCSVLEKEGKLLTSTPCEICPNSELFTYEDKYTQGGAAYNVPAENVPALEIQELSKQVFKVLGCSGMARVDLFYTEDGKIYINEVNTLPGFTRNSLFLKAFAADGISYREVIETLIICAKQSKGRKDASRDFSSSKERVLV